MLYDEAYEEDDYYEEEEEEGQEQDENENDWNIEDDADIIWIINIQYLKLRNAATPALAHSLTGYLDGIFIFMTKLVEWPVVDSVPVLLTTL